MILPTVTAVCLLHYPEDLNLCSSPYFMTMDPLSITASVVGITTAALQSVQFLVRTIDGVKGAPEIIEGVTADLRAIQPVLQSLLQTTQDYSSQLVLSEQIKHAVENCERACRTFQSQVEQWMENSNADRMFWVDRWKVGLFGLERIKTFRAQLNDCKGTLSVALSTATMYQPLVFQVYVFFSDTFQHYNIPPTEFDARDEGHDAPTERGCHSAADRPSRH